MNGQFPGASAETVAETVVAPIEQQINGVEGMLYLSSNSTADGKFSISVTFEIGTNLDIAQVQVQNRVSTATPRLPQQVQQIGVIVAKSSPDILMVVNLFSPDKSRDALFISNYANLQIKDVLTRVDGVGSITVFGARDYAMQVWLDPNRLQSLNLTAAGRDARFAGAERAGRVRRAQPAADAKSGLIPGRGAHAGAPVRSERIRQYHHQADDRCGGSHQGYRAGRACCAGLHVGVVPQSRSFRRHCSVPAPGFERADDRREHPQNDGGDIQIVSRSG